MDATPSHQPVLNIEGVVQEVDVAGRELKVLVDGALLLFDVPPQCPVFLHDERVKLRLLQPLDQIQIAYTQTPEARVASSLRGTGWTGSSGEARGERGGLSLRP